jgi:hypothetical protein
MLLVRQCLTTVALGVALWLSLGTLAVTSDHPAVRFAILPPFWLLGLTGLLAIIAVFWRSTPHRWLLIVPAALLVLPWLPLPIGLPPAALSATVFIWLGPVVTLVWATLCIAWLSDIRAAASAPRARAEPQSQTLVAPQTLGPTPAPRSIVARAGLVQHPMHAPLLAGACAFALFVFGAYQLSPWLPDGDEPHYLVIAQSLWHDGDLQIENNHRAGQYREYFARDLKPDYLRRGVNNQIYSIHAPGLPALILPAFAIGGYRAVTIWLALIAAFGTALAWRVCWLVTGNASASWIGWAAVTGAAPFFFDAFTVFPDGVASVIVLTGILALVRASDMTNARASLHGLALAMLPWLHTRYAILAGTLGLLIAWRLSVHASASTRVWRLAAFLAMPVASAIAWFAFFYTIYGTPNPAAPYGSATQGSWQTVPAGVAGLLVDQQFGLIVNAPIALVALGGLLWMLRRRSPHRRLAWEMAIVAVPYALATAAYPMWWGGWSAPARFLVPLALMCSVPVAVVWASARTQTTRAVVGVALGVTVWLTVLLLSIHRGRIVYNERDGFALWADWAGPVADLALGLPSLFRGAWPRALADAAVWAGALGGVWLLLHWIERRGRASWSRTPLFMTAIVPAAFGVAGMIACAGVWQIDGSDGLRALSVVADSRRTGAFRPVAQRGMHYASASSSGVEVFAISGGISLEPDGFWIEPAIDHALLVVTPTAAAPVSASLPAPASALASASTPASEQLRLALRNGPAENRVSMSVAGERWRREVTLAPNAETVVELPAARGGRTLLRIWVARGVRPSDLDPANPDHRLLGLRVELR